jgi:hypothetical protein
LRKVREQVECGTAGAAELEDEEGVELAPPRRVAPAGRPENALEAGAVILSTGAGLLDVEHDVVQEPGQEAVLGVATPATM